MEKLSFERKGTTPPHIENISCNVKNCKYHNSENLCTAEKISVGPSYACNCQDTICATFKQKTL
ncbi:MAG TPA: DUF1540 domain-containing protein [Clostridiales bacterium]|jgi:hypothetical protein|nr:DUF1540 domain-containing protein [Clostridiales bacterium]HCG35092.1 DUF1540 domain-containing protein [Clostridiales bacterium]